MATEMLIEMGREYKRVRETIASWGLRISYIMLSRIFVQPSWLSIHCCRSNDGDKLILNDSAELLKTEREMSKNVDEGDHGDPHDWNKMLIMVTYDDDEDDDIENFDGGEIVAVMMVVIRRGRTMTTKTDGWFDNDNETYVMVPHVTDCKDALWRWYVTVVRFDEDGDFLGIDMRTIMMIVASDVVLQDMTVDDYNHVIHSCLGHV